MSATLECVVEGEEAPNREAENGTLAGVMQQSAVATSSPTTRKAGQR